LYSNYVYKWLSNALEYGITEADFWNMTLAELDREFTARAKIEKYRAQERASYDYILADLIGRSISRIYSSSSKYPEISAAYPTLFDTKEIQAKKQEKTAELSALRFKMFAQSFNDRFKKEANNND
jgi:hypothetical protein